MKVIWKFYPILAPSVIAIKQILSYSCDILVHKGHFHEADFNWFFFRKWLNIYKFIYNKFYNLFIFCCCYGGVYNTIHCSGFVCLCCFVFFFHFIDCHERTVRINKFAYESIWNINPFMIASFCFLNNIIPKALTNGLYPFVCRSFRAIIISFFFLNFSIHSNNFFSFHLFLFFVLEFESIDNVYKIYMVFVHLCNIYIINICFFLSWFSLISIFMWMK